MIRFSMCWVFGIFLTSFVAAAEPLTPSPVEPSLIETKLPIRSTYPVKLHPPKNQQAEKAVIHLPESVVRELAAKLNEKRSGAVPLGGPRSDYYQPSDLPHYSTIIAGCALSLAMVGFMLLRQRRPHGAWLGGAVGVVFLGMIVANYSQANVAPPPEMILKHRLEAQQEKCLIWIVPDGEGVELFVPEK